MLWMLPLETLPGWPEAPPLAVGHLLLIILVLPAVTGLVIAILTFTPTWLRRSREGQETGTEVATVDHSADTSS